MNLFFRGHTHYLHFTRNRCLNKLFLVSQQPATCLHLQRLFRLRKVFFQLYKTLSFHRFYATPGKSTIWLCPASLPEVESIRRAVFPLITLTTSPPPSPRLTSGIPRSRYIHSPRRVHVKGRGRRDMVARGWGRFGGGKS